MRMYMNNSKFTNLSPIVNNWSTNGVQLILISTNEEVGAEDLWWEWEFKPRAKKTMQKRWRRTYGEEVRGRTTPPKDCRFEHHLIARNRQRVRWWEARELHSYSTEVRNWSKRTNATVLSVELMNTFTYCNSYGSSSYSSVLLSPVGSVVFAMNGFAVGQTIVEVVEESRSSTKWSNCPVGS